jgi:hypothetical protein
METYDVTLPVLVAVSQLDGACFIRINCGLFKSLDGKRHVRCTSVEGVADIMGLYFSRGTAIETKTLTGKQLETQRIFQRNWERAGGLYIIAREPAAAVAALLASLT